MHQTRNQVTKKIPIERKGTKYVARALGSLDNSVPAVIAVRDMLHLAKTTKEVKEMIKNKALKINGREVKDHRESIYLFNLFEADKIYNLTLLPTGRFVLEESKHKNERICKVIGKKNVSGNRIQINCHDGSNILSKEKIKNSDTIYLDNSGKITKVVSLEKGKDCFVISGKYAGQKGKVNSLDDGKITVHLHDSKNSVSLDKKGVVAL